MTPPSTRTTVTPGTPRTGGAAAARPAAKEAIDLGSIEFLQILNERGAIDARLDPGLPPAELLRIHRAMVLTRKLDLRMLAMQRQGEMGTFAPGLGQEATQIGQVYPMEGRDWFAPSYRSFGAQVWRGWGMDRLMLLWDGFFKGFEVPEGVNDLPFSIVIGSHVPVAVGVGMGMRIRGESAAVVVNFGDGASSQGPVAEAMNFAAVFKAPVVFMCENNGYAISVPVERQAGVRELARRGPGFGIPAIRVDGNDVLAVIVAVREALLRARRGEGPTWIEAVTYRMSLHTTADDPKVYRDDAEVKAWEARCPIARLEKHLLGVGLADRPMLDRVAQECEAEVLAARESFRRMARPEPGEIFDYVYAKLPPELEAQKAEYLERLRKKQAGD